MTNDSEGLFVIGGFAPFPVWNRNLHFILGQSKGWLKFLKPSQMYDRFAKINLIYRFLIDIDLLRLYNERETKRRAQKKKKNGKS